MIWRGMYGEALLTLSAQVSTLRDPEEAIHKNALEGVALARMRDFDRANQKFADAESICLKTVYTACGEIPMGRGVIALEHGQFDEARGFFEQCIDFGRLHHERSLELAALLNLGFISLQINHYDEAVDWSKLAYQVGEELGEENQVQGALGNLGAAYFGLGDPERALQLFSEAEHRAADIGNMRDQLKWLTTIGYVHMDAGQLLFAKNSYEQSLQLARDIDSKEDIADITADLAQVSVALGKPDEADVYLKRVIGMAQQSGSRPDMIDAVAIQMQAAALRGDIAGARQLLSDVEADPESIASKKWTSELAMARAYESHGEAAAAQNEYITALTTFENARAQLKHEESQLPFVANAARIYDDYIHFLVQQGKIEDALLAADQSRARTLSEGLGATGRASVTLSPRAVARKANATLLFYWLGQKQSYLWVITQEKVSLFPLPSQAEIAPLIERYSKALLGPEDPIEADNRDGRALYATLIAPASKLLRANAPVMILADGPLSKLNFETLIVPQSEAATRAHYWIEDAMLVSTPSLAMLASARPAPASRGNLLLVGDAVSPGPNYPQLPYASVEMQQIEKHFAARDQIVFARDKATPPAYLGSNPEQYAYIHFVSHGIASQTDPLDSAIILSRSSTAEDSFKLYGREIMQHSIDAQLVTISACYGNGTRAYVGEGLVGLSWAFLYAGAHNAIGALWEASDRSTAELMGTLYQGLESGEAPGVALRQAKLTLLHSRGNYRKPLYWAPFQMYTRL